VATHENYRRRLVRFPHEVLDELRKVVWPSRRDVLIYSMVVVVAIIAAATFVFALDQLFTRLIVWLFGP
jgi:preprotein translocase subunit SecE